MKKLEIRRRAEAKVPLAVGELETCGTLETSQPPGLGFRLVIRGGALWGLEIGENVF